MKSFEEPTGRPVSFYHGAPKKGTETEVIQYLEATLKQPVQGATSWGFRAQAAFDDKKRFKKQHHVIMCNIRAFKRALMKEFLLGLLLHRLKSKGAVVCKLVDESEALKTPAAFSETTLPASQQVQSDTIRLRILSGAGVSSDS